MLEAASAATLCAKMKAHWPTRGGSLCGTCLGIYEQVHVKVGLALIVENLARGKSLVEVVQVYVVKTPVAGSTSFVTRSLTLVRSHLDKKCIVFRVDHDWLGDAIARSMVLEIIFENREKSVLRSL